MKKREKEIIIRLLTDKSIEFDKLKEILKISRRTLYYDINNLNTAIKGIGTIIIKNKKVFITGDFYKIQKAVDKKDNKNYDQYLKYANRKRYVLDKIFGGYTVTTSSLAASMYVSNITIKDTIKLMKEELLEKGIYLNYQKGYQLKGSEKGIRELYLSTYYDSKRDLKISESVIKFNQDSQIRLTDYSENTLTAFVNFVSERINKKCIIEDIDSFQETKEFKHYHLVPSLFEIEIPTSEQIYMSAFISSLSSLNTLISKEEIGTIVDKIVDNIEDKLMIYFKDKQECKKNLYRHISTSYYRIKYQFPIHNPLLEEIKFKFKSLFQITKNLFISGNLSLSLIGIRDEEIAYIVSYLGSYLFKDDLARRKSYKVLIACPNGITISKTIQYQLERHFPRLIVIDSISVTEIDTYDKEYDFLISTMEIPGIDNIIVVNPLLRNFDLDIISKTIFNTPIGLNQINIEDLISGIDKYTIIEDEENLRKFLYSIIYETNGLKGGSWMLKETLLPNRIRFLDKCENWEVAIKEASLPLLDQGAIEEEYVEAMIDSVKTHGPYIVLDDYFALAHARPNQGVNELSLSLLKLDQPVDLLGSEVKIIVVLAATDNKKHLKALASLTELFMVKENINKIMNAKKIETVIELIELYS